MQRKGQAAADTTLGLVVAAVVIIIALFIGATFVQQFPTTAGSVANGSENISGTTGTLANVPVLAISAVEFISGSDCPVSTCYNLTSADLGTVVINTTGATNDTWFTYTFQPSGLWLNQSAEARTTISSVNTTFFTSFNLLAILLIVIAAVAVLAGVFLLRGRT